MIAFQWNFLLKFIKKILARGCDARVCVTHRGGLEFFVFM